MQNDCRVYMDGSIKTGITVLNHLGVNCYPKWDELCIFSSLKWKL